MMSDRYLMALDQAKLVIRENSVLRSYSVFEHDWAFLETLEDIQAQPIKISELINFELPAQRSGYSVDRPASQLVDLQCTVKKVRDSQLMEHTCTSLSGGSGSPLLQNKGGEDEIIGVHVAVPHAPLDRRLVPNAVALGVSSARFMSKFLEQIAVH